MADDSEFLFLIAFPILVAENVNFANLVVLIKYGRPFNKGHSSEGLLFLISGAFVNFFTFVYCWKTFCQFYF